VADAVWEQVWVKDGTEVWRATAPTGHRYVKVGSDGGPDGIAAEAARLAWLGRHAPAPSVLAHTTSADDGRGWLVTSAAPGVPAHDPRFRMTSVERLLDRLGEGLRHLHDTLPVAECPFDARLDTLLSLSAERVAAGLVDTADLEPAYRGSSPAELLDHLHRSRPDEPPEDLVVAHGDPCLPNLLVDPVSAELVSVVDVGRLGVSDRYRDLGIIARSLVSNVGPEVASRFFDAYGVARPDLLRLEYYVLLDELW